MATSDGGLGPDVKGIPYADEINASAHKNGLPPALLAGLIKQESGFDPNISSSAGAVGLTQLMPGTAASVGVTDSRDPAQSIEGGARYLKAQIDTFGNVPEALAAYNAGPGAVRKHGGIPPFAETQAYVKKVEANAASYAGGVTPDVAKQTRDRNLEVGSRGEDVKALQAKLGVAQDGDFGPKTEAAVKAFQREHHLAVDGVVGSATRGAFAPVHHPSAPGSPAIPATPAPPISSAAPGVAPSAAHPGWTEAPAPPGQHKFLAPNLQEFEKTYKADPNRPDVSVRWDEKTSTLTASFSNDKNERFVSTVRTAHASDSVDVDGSGNSVVLRSGTYEITNGRHQAEAWGDKGTGRAFSSVLNTDGTDGIPDVNGKLHTQIGLHGGGSYVANHQGLDAAFADRQDLHGTNGCVRLHNVDAASIADLTADAGKPLQFEVRGRSSQQVSVSDAVGALRSEKGIGLPPVARVEPWDGKAHEGTFVRVDDHTWAQHVGRGSYQLYDADHDFRGKPPLEGQRLEINQQGIVTPAHEASHAVVR